MNDQIKSREFEVKISGISSQGNGVGKIRVDSKEFSVFVPNTIPGDVVLAKEISRKGPVLEGEVLSIISQSPHRVKPPCPYFGSCGGCSIQHVAYAEQLRQKKDLVFRCVSTFISSPSGVLQQIIPARKEFGTRTRGRFHVSEINGSKILGLFASKSSELVDIDSCLVLDPRLDLALKWVRRFWLEELPSGSEVHLVLDEAKDRVLGAVSIPGDVSLVTGPPIEFPEEKPPLWLSLQIGERQEGAFLYPIKGDRPLRYAPEVFTQSDVIQNRVLVTEVLSVAGASIHDKVLDLFCGIGNFSLPLAKRAKVVEGIDGSRRSIEIAKTNAIKWNCKNTSFFKGDVGGALRKIVKKGKRFEIVVVDPPRVGMGEDIKLLDSIAKKRIIYISCNPKTLAKDLLFLEGFKVVRVQPIDMFPQTMHVETVVVLERDQSKSGDPSKRGGSIIPGSRACPPSTVESRIKNLSSDKSMFKIEAL